MRLDIYHTWEPFEEPFFTQIDIGGRLVPIGSIPRTLMMKAQDVVLVNPDPQAIAKDEFYFDLLRRIADQREVYEYLEAYIKYVPAHIERPDRYVDFLIEHGLLFNW